MKADQLVAQFKIDRDTGAIWLALSYSEDSPPAFPLIPINAKAKKEREDEAWENDMEHYR